MRSHILFAVLMLFATKICAVNTDSVVVVSFEEARATGLSFRPSMPGKTEVNRLSAYCYQRGTGQIIPNCSISIKAKGVPGSGGHNHASTARPAGTASPASGSSGTSGIFYFNYTSPEASGLVELTVMGAARGQQITPGVAQFPIEIKGLTLMPLPSADYNLVGSTPIHLNNHYLVPGFSQKLFTLARQYKAAFPGNKLNFNDMSLVSGGVFDLNQTWKSPHAEHRIGFSEDLRLVPASQRAKLELMIKSLGLGINKEEGNNHWHLRFDPKGRS